MSPSRAAGWFTAAKCPRWCDENRSACPISVFFPLYPAGFSVIGMHQPRTCPVEPTTITWERRRPRARVRARLTSHRVASRTSRSSGAPTRKSVTKKGWERGMSARKSATPTMPTAPRPPPAHWDRSRARGNQAGIDRTGDQDREHPGIDDHNGEPQRGLRQLWCRVQEGQVLPDHQRDGPDRPRCARQQCHVCLPMLSSGPVRACGREARPVVATKRAAPVLPGLPL